ncbi:MAG: hypothetical protein EA343_00880, partial [Nodularia sp. (in: Bacteria)]
MKSSSNESFPEDQADEVTSPIHPDEKTANLQSSHEYNDTTLTASTIQRVEEGVAAASDRAVRHTIEEILHRLEAMAQGHRETRVHAIVRRFVLRSLIHALFRVR